MATPPSVQGTSTEFVIDVSVKLKDDLNKITSNLDKLTRAMEKVAQNAGINATAFKQSGIDVRLFGESVKSQEQIMFEFNRQMAQVGAEAQALPNKIAALKVALNQLSAAGKQNTAEFVAYSNQLKQLGGNSNVAGIGLKNLRGQVQNASFQITDFIVSVQGGTKASVALGQQLPQLLAGFGAWGAALGLVASLLGPFIARMFEAEKETKTLADLSDQLSQGFTKVGESASRMNMNQLVETYNKANAETRKLIRSNLELQLVLEQSRVARLKDKAAADARAAAESAEPGFFTRQLPIFDTARLSTYNKTLDNLAEKFKINRTEAAKFLEIQTKLANGQQTYAKFADELAKSVPEGKLSQGAIGLVDELRNLDNALQESAKTSKDAKKAFDEFSKAGDTGQVKIQEEITKGQKKTASASSEALKEQRKSLQELKDEYLSLYDAVKTPAEKLADIRAKLDEITGALRDGADPEVIKRIYDKALADNADEITKSTTRWKESLVTAGQEVDNVTPKLEFLRSELQRLRDSGQEGSGYFQVLTEEYQKLNPMIQTIIEEFENLADKLKSSKTPVEDFKQVTAELTQQFNAGEIGLASYTALLAKLKDAYDSASKDNNLTKALEEINNKIGTVVSGVFDDIINNIGKAKFSMADFAESFLRDIAKMITQLLIVKPLMESLGPVVSDWGKSIASSLTGAATSIATSTATSTVAPVVQGGSTAFGAVAKATSVQPISRSVASGGSSAMGGTVVNVNNTISNQAQIDVSSKTGVDGVKTLDIMVTSKVRELFANGTMDQQMRSTFGIRRQPA